MEKPLLPRVTSLSETNASWAQTVTALNGRAISNAVMHRVPACVLLVSTSLSWLLTSLAYARIQDKGRSPVAGEPKVLLSDGARLLKLGQLGE